MVRKMEALVFGASQTSGDLRAFGSEGHQSGFGADFWEILKSGVSEVGCPGDVEHLEGFEGKELVLEFCRKVGIKAERIQTGFTVMKRSTINVCVVCG